MNKNKINRLKQKNKGSAIMLVLLASIIILSLASLFILQQKNYRSRINIFLNDNYWYADYVKQQFEDWLSLSFQAKDNDNDENSSIYEKIINDFISSGNYSANLNIKNKEIYIELKDISNCLNVNSFQKKYNNFDEEIEIDIRIKRIFAQYFAYYGILPQLELTIMESFIDWIDKDNIPQRSGAEANYYDAKNLSAANQLMFDESEFNLIRGFNEIEVENKNFYEQLCVLNNDKVAILNLQSFKEENIPILIALSSGKLTYDNAKELFAAHQGNNEVLMSNIKELTKENENLIDLKNAPNRVILTISIKNGSDWQYFNFLYAINNNQVREIKRYIEVLPYQRIENEK